jgi:hypothetical protein
VIYNKAVTDITAGQEVTITARDTEGVNAFVTVTANRLAQASLAYYDMIEPDEADYTTVATSDTLSTDLDTGTKNIYLLLENTGASNALFTLTVNNTGFILNNGCSSEFLEGDGGSDTCVIQLTYNFVAPGDIATATISVEPDGNTGGAIQNWTVTARSIFSETVEDPVIGPSLNSYVLNEDININMSTETAGAAIYYTMDGSDPDCTSTEYTAPFLETISSSFTVKAIACNTGMNNSSIVAKDFNLATWQDIASPSDNSDLPYVASINGRLFAAFRDRDNGDRASVKILDEDSGTWSYYGEEGFSDGAIGRITLA